MSFGGSSPFDGVNFEQLANDLNSQLDPLWIRTLHFQEYLNNWVSANNATDNPIPWIIPQSFFDLGVQIVPGDLFVPSVPEPSVYGMFLIGVGLIWFVWNKSKKNKEVTLNGN